MHTLSLFYPFPKSRDMRFNFPETKVPLTGEVLCCVDAALWELFIFSEMHKGLVVSFSYLCAPEEALLAIKHSGGKQLIH